MSALMPMGRHAKRTQDAGDAAHQGRKWRTSGHCDLTPLETFQRVLDLRLLLFLDLRELHLLGREAELTIRESPWQDPTSTKSNSHLFKGPGDYQLCLIRELTARSR